MECGIRIAGAAGQGMQTAAELLGKAACRDGLHVSCYTDAESRIRGGLNFSHLRIGTGPVGGVRDDFDVLVALSPEAEQAFAPRLGERGVLLCEQPDDQPAAVPLGLSRLAEEAGSTRAAGTVGIAAACALLGIERTVLGGLLREHFAGKDEVVDINLRAAELARRAVASWSRAGTLKIEGRAENPPELYLAGHEAVALGAVAGGAAFVAGYPMSPATGTLADLAGWAEELGILVEQAEDEIAAINMVAGASYAGARAMTATSGGGFCLMSEGVSLLGMIEAPAVVVVAQRPGPSTGLPTRTAQSDLHLVLHAGQGFFPRVILAPAGIRDCFEVTARAFDLAERFQVPVFVLTDQLLQDGQAGMANLVTHDLPAVRHLLAADALAAMDVYRRYELTDSGISPQAAPGNSRHVVVVDSDEHDQDGHLTESAEMADAMARKRLRKARTIEEAELLAAPLLEDDPGREHLVLSWGSTDETLREACARLACRGRTCSRLHLRQLWPLPVKQLLGSLERVGTVTVVENNVSGELATLLARISPRRVDHRILRMDGRPFDVAGLEERLEEVLA